MVTKKKLYEISQAYEARIGELEKRIEGLSLPLYSTTQFGRLHETNPLIVNAAEYVDVLTAKDIIEATNRYITEIPELNLPSNRLEMMWYIYGSLCFYRDGRAKVGMYAKTGTLNGIGDLTEIEPIDFAGHSYGKRYNVVYDDKATKNAAVIINDYTGTYIEGNIVPRSLLNSVSIKDQSFTYSAMRRAIKLTAKKAVALCNDESQRAVVEKTLNAFFDNESPVASLVGETIGDVMKIVNIDTKLEIEEYMKAIDKFEQLRANFNGIPTEHETSKKERALEAEMENVNTVTNFMLYDGYFNRIIGLELCKKHAIINDYTCKINPILLPNENDSSDDEKSKNLDKNGGNKEGSK